jgi:hypothetical protein
MMLVGVCSAGLTTAQHPAASAGAIFQQGKVPGDDLSYYSDGFMESDADSRFVVFADRAFLASDDPGEISEMVYDEGQVGGPGFPDSLPVVDGLYYGEVFEVVFDHLCYFQQQVAAIRGGCSTPFGEGSVCGVNSLFYISGISPGGLGEHFAVNGGGIVEIFAAIRFYPLAINKMIVSF